MAGFGATFDAFCCLVPTSHGPSLQLGWRRGKGKMLLAAPTGSGGDESVRSLQDAETARLTWHLTWPGWGSIRDTRLLSVSPWQLPAR